MTRSDPAALDEPGGGRGGGRNGGGGNMYEGGGGGGPPEPNISGELDASPTPTKSGWCGCGGPLVSPLTLCKPVCKEGILLLIFFRSQNLKLKVKANNLTSYH